ncbi:methyl-accepting chemotaxis protein [Magnetovibrio sp.]|uniref:methyl-accepting chemotaxis protein n=1 Tax=Magnetovibrio sp. TaxID=2024836 RepID=UPI002F9478F6
MSARNEFTRLGLMMVGLGVMVGLIFPPFMLILGVPQEIALRPVVFAATIACGIALGAFNIVLARLQIGRRLTAMKDAIQDLADERAVDEIPCSENDDVFGDIARAIAVLRDHADKKRELERRQVEEAQRINEEKAEEREALAYDFEAGVKGAMSGAQKDTASLQKAARAMGESAEQSLSKAQSAIELSDAATQGVDAVAQAAESMAKTVRDLSSRMRRSSEMSQHAVERVSQADALVAELGEATARIESVAGLIIDIADQTNMLALNATIEAARAGSAGKGFAVVAGEVKNLANQTAKATDEITAHIDNIRGAGMRARDAMVAVSSAIDEINSIAGDVTRAAEEQNETISDISVNARETSDATGQSLAYIRDVGKAIEETGLAAHEMLATVDDLARQMGVLTEKADNFVENVRKG